MSSGFPVPTDRGPIAALSYAAHGGPNNSSSLQTAEHMFDKLTEAGWTLVPPLGQDVVADAGVPYVIKQVVIKYRLWNPEFDAQALCGCGHPYYRHFDGYEANAAIGCKYCMCELWHEPGSEYNNELLGTVPRFPPIL